MAEDSATKKTIRDSLNVKKRCDEYGVGLWQCPEFLFIVMGLIIILAIVATNVVARRYAEPEVSALIVLGVTALLFIVGNSIVKSFEILAEASRSKSEFMRIISYELRTPLSGIKWQIDLLTDKKSSLSSPELDEIYDSLEEQNNKMIRLINTLLEIYKLEDKKLQLKPKSFSLKSLTQKEVKKFENMAKQEGSVINFSATGDSFDVLADEEKIKLVLGHLLDNAIRYGKGGEVFITIEKQQNRIIWTISDQGVGIPKRDLKNIFSKFFRSQNVLRYKTEGAGLGLYLTNEIIKLSGGKIKVKSIEGRGSTFWFDLPVPFMPKEKK